MSAVQLVSFADAAGAVRTGLMQDGKIYASPSYASMRDVLDDWGTASAKLAGIGDKLASREAVSGARLVAPLPNPRNIYFAGANYSDHLEEMVKMLGMKPEANWKESGQKPWHSLQATSSVVGPNAIVKRPQNSPMLDWEIELAVIIGKRCSHVPVNQAYDYVAGYTIANDLSAREHIKRKAVPMDSPFHYDWIAQKSFDGGCPMGPAMTPHAAIGDVSNLALKLWVNDALMQDSNTGKMIFDVADQVSYLSSRITLMPGDVIITGTPSGVGMARGKFLQPGDRVRQMIQNIGEFEFSIE
ncbi:MAG: fumarylacetoacetate hydrolase family protein [Burkholderiaceae bacterium]